MDSKEVSEGQERTPKAPARAIAPLVLGGLAVLFAVVNLDKVKVNWILGSWRTPLIVVIGVSFGIGIVVGALTARRSARRAE